MGFEEKMLEEFFLYEYVKQVTPMMRVGGGGGGGGVGGGGIFNLLSL